MITKGPWKADNVTEGYIYAGETLIASAQCETLHFKAKGVTPAQMNDNARLIAAAPALLAACENALASISVMSMPRLDESAASNDEILAIMAESFKIAIAAARL